MLVLRLVAYFWDYIFEHQVKYYLKAKNAFIHVIGKLEKYCLYATFMLIHNLIDVSFAKA